MSLSWREPLSVALALRDEPGLVLLESRPGFGDLGRRSYLSAAPSEVRTTGLADLDSADDGWWAGWLSYDLGRQIERLPRIARDDTGLPPLALGRYEAWLEFDHAARRVALCGDSSARHLERALARAGDEAQQPGPHTPVAGWGSSLERDAYESAVERAIEYIRAGDVFQVNLSRRLSAAWDDDPFALYSRLRRSSPAPFAALVRLGGADLVSASPERFLRRTGKVLETRPIKGTRPRNPDPALDEALARELRASAKDKAENVMIVDLARNDLGRVARFGTVEVTGLWDVERHPGLHHLVSEVRAEVGESVSVQDLVRATFPPGSVTGAPKIRALELIDELEPVRRGPYCGAIGHFGPGPRLELSVAIRTFVAERGRLHLHAGGAVVADSDPAAEWAETEHKAARLLAAAGAASLERPEVLIRGPRERSPEPAGAAR